MVCSDFLAAAVRAAACVFLISRLLAGKNPEKKTVCAAAAVAAAVSVLISAAGLPDFNRVALETVGIVVCVRRLQKSDARMTLFVAVFYELAAAFYQFLFAAWLGVLFHSPAFLNRGTRPGQLPVWCLHLLLLILMLFLEKHPHQTARKAFHFVSLIAIAGFFSVFALSVQTVLPLDSDTLNMWIYLSVVFMMSILIFSMNRRYAMEKELARLKSEQAELLERDYTALNNAYALHAKLFHDFHNHIGVLHQLLSHGKTDAAIQYLDELQAPGKALSETVWTGDETVDYLINSKSAAARESGISCQIQAEFPRGTNLRSADLCAILGNLLDNALEAAVQAPDPQNRFIRLTIRRINQMLVIKVENSFSTPPVQEAGTLKTTKKEPALHGWGLKSARTAAEKYDGILQTSSAANTFQAVATLSYQPLNPAPRDSPG